MISLISVKENYFWNLANKGVNMVLPLVLTPYITRILSSEQLGLYSYSLTIASYFITFIMLSLSMYGVRSIATSYDKNREFSLLFTIQVLNSVIVVSAYLLYVYFIGVKKIEQSFLYNCCIY